MAIRSLITALLVCALAACTTSVPQPSTGSPHLLSPPPAASAIDHTVSIEWQLADSFDVFPNGSCTGRSIFTNMGAGLRVQIRGRTTGLTDETRATARVENLTAGTSASRYDDGVDCVIAIVFDPDVPDPDGYWLHFPGSQQADEELRALNRGVGPIFSRGEPVEQPTLPPGYGRYNTRSQSCPSALDPPDKDCPILVP